MKIPKTFNKMSVEDQEKWLVKQLMLVHSQEEKLRKMLAQVRGGQRIELRMDVRPDEIVLKETA
jgi:Fe-S cluster biosynthesis and repair protein YggX